MKMKLISSMTLIAMLFGSLVASAENQSVEKQLKDIFSKIHAKNETMISYARNGEITTEVVCGPGDAQSMDLQCVVMSQTGDDGGKFYLTTKVVVFATGDENIKFEVLSEEPLAID